MLTTALYEERIKDPVLLMINPNVLFLRNTMFTNLNAARNGIWPCKDFKNFKDIKFDLFSQSYRDLELWERPYFQAEILVLDKIPINSIINIKRKFVV